jgi:hypothetical protein
MFILLSLVTLAIGCAPKTGVVTETSGPLRGDKAPDIDYVSAEGKSATMNGARNAIAIIAFVDSPGATCCWLHPDVVKISDEMWDLPVSVIQVLRPTEPCPHGKSCIEGCNLREAGLIGLCDATMDASDAYGQPKDGTLFLIDRDNTILRTGSLDMPAAVVEQAKRLGQIEKERIEGSDRKEIY